MCVCVCVCSYDSASLSGSIGAKPHHITDKTLLQWGSNTESSHRLSPLSLSFFLCLTTSVTNAASVSSNHTIKHMWVWLLLSVSHTDKRMSSEQAGWVTYVQGWPNAPQAVRAYSPSSWQFPRSMRWNVCFSETALFDQIIHASVQATEFPGISPFPLLLSLSKASEWVVFSQRISAKKPFCWNLVWHTHLTTNQSRSHSFSHRSLNKQYARSERGWDKGEYTGVSSLSSSCRETWCQSFRGSLRWIETWESKGKGGIGDL